MDCRETQTVLTAFHDGELPDADRARVEIHLRGCPECGRLLADLARADEAAGVPDPGPGYWERFNARLADRIGREAEGPKAAVLRPKQGWIRQQLRFLVPAVAAAALIVGIVRITGLGPVAPTPTRPPAETVTKPPALDSAGQRMGKTEQEPPAASKPGDAAAARRVPAESERAPEAPAAPHPAVGEKRIPTVGREGPEKRADRLRPEGKERTSEDRAAAPAGIGAIPPPMLSAERSATVGSMPVAEEEGRYPKAREERKKMAGDTPPATEPQLAAKAESDSGRKDERASSPCEMAQALAARERFREAESAQRECLAQDPSPSTQEKGLVFLAELLDRQARFAEADEVLAEVHRQFPKSQPLDLYRQQRPMVQKHQIPAPATRWPTP